MPMRIRPFKKDDRRKNVQKNIPDSPNEIDPKGRQGNGGWIISKKTSED